MRPELVEHAKAGPVPEEIRARFAQDVRLGLGRQGQKTLPSKYLYDSVGSSLFEVICLLPEYGVHRAGARVLRSHAESIAAVVETPIVVELGSGNARNTRWVLDALARRGTVTYCPIDISRLALRRAEQEFDGHDAVNVVGLEREYLDGLRVVTGRRARGETVLVLFLGGTIGNFDRPAADAFLRQVRSCLAPGDFLLLSTDLVKPPEVLVPAYDDPIGATAAFNLNVLARINRELGGTFDLSAFRHEARWNASERRIEMHLRAETAQTVRIEQADLTVRFRPAETIWTESSHKFRLEEIPGLAERAGFRCEGRWMDSEWPFSQNLFRAV